MTQRGHAFPVDAKRLQVADPANQKGRPMWFMVSKVHLPGIADADQKLLAARLLLRNDPFGRAPHR